MILKIIQNLTINIDKKKFKIRFYISITFNLFLYNLIL